MKVRELIEELMIYNSDAEISINTTDNRLPWISVERLDVTLRDKVVLVPTTELARAAEMTALLQEVGDLREEVRQLENALEEDDL